MKIKLLNKPHINFMRYYKGFLMLNLREIGGVFDRDFFEKFGELFLYNIKLVVIRNK